MNIFKKLFGSKEKHDPTLQPVKPSANTQSLGAVYEGTPGIRQLITKESPGQILSKDFPRHYWPISGGWGYSQEDAVVIELNNSSEGIGFEYKFLEYRSYEEAIILCPEDQKLAGFRFQPVKQTLIHGDNGKIYDYVIISVSAFPEYDFLDLSLDWEIHNAYEDDEVGKQRHLQLADAKRIKYQVWGWFDITRFYGKNNIF